MTNKFKSTAFLLNLMILNGCTPYMESFDCPPGLGVGCKSLSQVNDMVEDGNLPIEGNSSQENVESNSPGQAKSVKDTPLIEARNEESPLNLIPQNPLRPNTPLKVWVAGYEESIGEEQIIHAPSVVYIANKV